MRNLHLGHNYQFGNMEHIDNLTSTEKLLAYLNAYQQLQRKAAKRGITMCVTFCSDKDNGDFVTVALFLKGEWVNFDAYQFKSELQNDIMLAACRTLLR